MVLVCADVVGLLRFVLRTNAVFSAMSSLALLLLARPLARMIALGEEGLATLGVNLVIFSVILFFVSTRRALARTLTLVVILGIAVADIGWVLASLLLAALPSYTTPGGRMLVLGTALAAISFS